MGTLYIVSVSFTSWDDVTLRAWRVLREAAAVVGDDSDRTRAFLAGQGIDAPFSATPGPEDGAGQARILSALQAGDVALLQDDGFPGPSRPARRLIRAALAAGFPVVPIPGPSRALTALVASGLPADSFLFLGSFQDDDAPSPASFAGERRTLVVFEPPERVAAALHDLLNALGDRPLALDGTFSGWPGRIWRGMLSMALKHLAAYPAVSECALVIGGAPEAPSRWDEARLRAEVGARIAQGLGAREISQTLAAESGWSRRAIYRLATELRR